MDAEDVLRFAFETIATERKKYASLSLQHIGARDALDSVRDILVNFKHVAIKGDDERN